MMKRIMAATVALLMSGTVTTAAQAAVITKSYQVVSTFNRGPMAKITSSFDLTFDDSIVTSGEQPITLSNFKSDGGIAFTDPTVGSFYLPRGYSGNGASSRSFTIGGNGDPGGMSIGTNDFMIILSTNIDGTVLSSTTMYILTTGTSPINDWSTTAVNIATAAVPEPATWAMMALGFCLVAGAARYRRRTTNVVYA